MDTATLLVFTHFLPGLLEPLTPASTATVEPAALRGGLFRTSSGCLGCTMSGRSGSIAVHRSSGRDGGRRDGRANIE